MPLVWRDTRFCLLLLTIAILSPLSPIALAQVTPSTVVAKQGTAVVTLDDIDAFAQSIPEKDRAGFFDSPDRLQSLISNLLLKRQLAAEGRALGLEKDPVVKSQIELATDDALTKARMKRFRTDLKIPDLSELAKEEYVGHKEKYMEGGKQQKFADVRDQILTKLRGDYVDNQVKNHTDVLRNKTIDANPDLVASLRTRYGQEPAMSGAVSGKAK